MDFQFSGNNGHIEGGAPDMRYRYHLCHGMRNPAYAICEQQSRRSACSSAQSDERLRCRLPRWHNTYSCYTRNSNGMFLVLSSDN